MRAWNPYKYKVRRIVKTIESYRFSGSKTTLNKVLLDCGHIASVLYWPMPYHYKPGDKCRCRECARVIE